MTDYPRFPDFRPLTLEDRDFITSRLWAYQPQVSEMTFTNLFIWQTIYQTSWAVLDDHLLFLVQDEGERFYFLPPMGPGPRLEIARTALRWLRTAWAVETPRIERADARLAEELRAAEGFTIEPTREHFDYVYAREALATLAGRKYSAKRNHINSFLREHTYVYEPMNTANIEECLRVACIWCEKHRCEDDMSLLEERDAVFAALKHFDALQVVGGVIRVDGLVQAFTIGEMLNQDTFVVHIEKADPDIRGLYPLINQQFAQHGAEGATWINREQDMGEPGLRRAKESYYPHHFVEKFRIWQRG
ncbi:MAG TPA: phosphatidylglycerol lysyltransferase domain-containing protein [Anaerolineae bacterium]|nr:phosphatidylglycerol lysyltransferase domain-containing protein [Anaerolineae bacterium]